MAMFLLAYHVSIDEHRSVQYVIEQYGENNKQSIGIYIQLHQTSALKPEKLHSKQQNIGGDKVWQIVLYLPNYNCTNIM